jgi:signal transduction histidine kinase/CheY-like chemotaxis protein
VVEKPTYEFLVKRVKELESQRQRLQSRFLRDAQIQSLEQARLLEAMLASLPVGVAILDEKGGMIRANNHFHQIWAGTRPTADVADFAQYKAWWANTGETIQPQEWAAAQAVQEGQVATGQVLQIERFDGTRAIVHNSAAPIRDAVGRIIGAAVAIQDITDLRQTEDALRAAKENLEQQVAARTAEVARAGETVRAERQRLLDVLETLPDMICLLTPDHHVAFANRAFRQMFGESHGRHCYEYCFGRSTPCEFCESFRVLETGRPHRWEVETPDGTVIDAHDYPFTDADGSQMVLELDVDITEQRRAARELKAVQESLETRAAQLRDLAGELTLAEQRERRRMAKILHDHLQQLLVAAKFRMSILGRVGDDVIRQGLREVEGLLDEAIGSSRSLTAELSPPILHEGGLVAGLEWLVGLFADRHGLFVELSADENVLPLTDDVRVLLFESVRELLLNVVKHARTRSAMINVRDVDGTVQVVVADKGAGFDPERLPQLGGKDQGFGLFSIKERLGFIGGGLRIQSEPGMGSRFVLIAPLTDHLPAEVFPRAPGPADAATPPPPAAPRIGTRISVLLVDDHAVMREGLAKLLALEPDLEVVGQASDGEEAVELARRLLPDVILMDLSMPRLNGVEATRVIHSEYPAIRILGLSMFVEPEPARSLQDAGAVGYLTKSGPPEVLLNAIRKGGSTST